MSAPEDEEDYGMGEAEFDNSLARPDSRYMVSPSRGGVGTPSRVIPAQIPNSVFLSYDPYNNETVEKVNLLKDRLISSGKTVKESTVSRTFPCNYLLNLFTDVLPCVCLSLPFVARRVTSTTVFRRS
jgi:hypothetical protein